MFKTATQRTSDVQAFIGSALTYPRAARAKISPHHLTPEARRILRLVSQKTREPLLRQLAAETLSVLTAGATPAPKMIEESPARLFVKAGRKLMTHRAKKALGLVRPSQLRRPGSSAPKNAR